MSCRTNVVLNYFGEYRSEPCGHCDHCTNPPQGFDGTKFAQMALSACKRCEESVGINLLIDVLRGSQRHEIMERNFHRIKTYGAGKELSYKEWAYYITQMINQGLLEIDYTQHSVLKCTPLSDDVLFNGRKITLHRQVEAPVEPWIPRQTKAKKFSEALLHELELLTNRLAREEGVPAYADFPLGTLKEMAEVRPFTQEEFVSLKGIGEYKSGKYGQEYLETIRDFMTQQDIVKKPKGGTYIETLRLFNKGLTLEQIAKERNMVTGTIASHLARLYEKGENIDLRKWVSERDLVMARQAWRASEFSDQMSKIKEQVGDSLAYDKLNLAMAILRKEKKEEEVEKSEKQEEAEK
jgi:ATP-dependent DNA helicase RecQ